MDLMGRFRCRCVGREKNNGAHRKKTTDEKGRSIEEEINTSRKLNY
jgi:hypothetical protein